MLATAACRAAEETLSTGTKRHIRLDNLSRTTLPVDIERALRRLRVVGVEDVQLELFRFLPTRRAYVTLTHPDFLQRTLAQLKDAVIGGHRITSVPSLEPLAIKNLRGARGRKAFIERQPPPGAIASGAMSSGRQVCLWGFPPRTSVESVKNFLEQSEIDMLGGQPEICKVHLQAREFSLFSRYLVRTSSISNSYHLARRIHRTFFRPEMLGPKFQLRAYVIQ